MSHPHNTHNPIYRSGVGVCHFVRRERCRITDFLLVTPGVQGEISQSLFLNPTSLTLWARTMYLSPLIDLFEVPTGEREVSDSDPSRASAHHLNSEGARGAREEKWKIFLNPDYVGISIIILALISAIRFSLFVSSPYVETTALDRWMICRTRSALRILSKPRRAHGSSSDGGWNKQIASVDREFLSCSNLGSRLRGHTQLKPDP